MNFLLNAAVRTHVGRVRENNEDNYDLCGICRENVDQKEASASCCCGANRFLAAIADGMGGEAYGEIASHIAVKTLQPCAFSKVKETALNSITRANRAICNEIEKNGGRRSGSTLVALYLDSKKAQCCNLGDSRCYLLRNGEFTQISTDHNKAAQMVAFKILTPEQAAKHSSRHELIQHLGIFEEEMILEPAFSPAINLEDGDKFLLCSDGLTDLVSDAEISGILSENAAPEQLTEQLVHLALERGGKDNVTVLIVRVQRDERSFLQRIFGLKGGK